MRAGHLDDEDATDLVPGLGALDACHYVHAAGLLGEGDGAARPGGAGELCPRDVVRHRQRDLAVESLEVKVPVGWAYHRSVQGASNLAGRRRCVNQEAPKYVPA